MNKKPDTLVILSIVFGLGILVSTIVHHETPVDHSRYAKSAGIAVTVTTPHR